MKYNMTKQDLQDLKNEYMIHAVGTMRDIYVHNVNILYKLYGSILTEQEYKDNMEGSLKIKATLERQLELVAFNKHMLSLIACPRKEAKALHNLLWRI